MDSEHERVIRRAALYWELTGIGVAILVALLLLGGLGYLVHQRLREIEAERRKKEEPQEEAIPVVIMPIEPRFFADVIRLPGRIQPGKVVEVPAEVAGVVMATPASHLSPEVPSSEPRKRGLSLPYATPVAEGSFVEANQILLQLDPSEYRLAYQQAKAALDLAQKNLRRTRELVAQAIKTKAELETDESLFLQAKARYEAAELNLQRCAIRSPIAGIVEKIDPEIGEFVGVGTKVATVVDVSRVKVEIGVPERDIHAVRSMKTCMITIASLVDENGKPLRVEGERTFLSQQPIPEALVYLLRLEMPNPDGRLRPGLLVEAEIPREIRNDALVIPLFAVVPRDSGYAVFVVEEEPPGSALPPPPGREHLREKHIDGEGRWGIARQRMVQLGAIQKHVVEIREGLKPGDRVMIRGQRSVEDGMRVRIIQSVRDPEELLR